MKTIIQFDLIRLGENDYCADPTTLYIFGFINFNMLKELITSPDYLNDMVENLEIEKPKTVTMQVWEDSDGYRTWLDYELLPNDYEIALPDSEIKPNKPLRFDNKYLEMNRPMDI